MMPPFRLKREAEAEEIVTQIELQFLRFLKIDMRKSKNAKIKHPRGCFAGSLLH